MTKSESQRVSPIGIPGSPGTRPAIGPACDNCPALFDRILYDRRDHPEATGFQYRCNPQVDEGRSEMTGTILFFEKKPEVKTTTASCGLRSLQVIEKK